MRPWVRDLLTGISLANLCFIAAWDEVLAVTRNRYLLDLSSADIVAVILNVLLVGTAFAAAASLARRHPSPWPRRIVRAVFLAVLLVPLWRLVRDFNPLYLERLLYRLGQPLSQRQVLRELAPMAPVLVFATWPVRSARRARQVLLFLFPFTLVTFGRGLWTLAAGDLTARYADEPAAPALPPPTGHDRPRVVILLLDQLGQGEAFAERAPGDALPALDRVRAEAVYATQALRAGSRTVIAVPAMLSGRGVDTAMHREPSELQVKFAGERAPVAWSTAPNLFTWARAHGLNVGLVGWYHPYCRIFGDIVTRCAWRPHADAISRDRAGLGPRMAAQLRSLSPWDPRRRHVEDYSILLDLARAAVTDSTLQLVFVHLNVPHTPPIYNRRQGPGGGFSLHNGRLDGHLDNLVIADRAVGELRHSMEAAGLWERTALIVLSDHPRGVPRRERFVPFLVRMPGGVGATTDRQFPTARLALLAQDVLAGRVTTATDVVRWIDGR
jgi:hypothetical protein